MHIKTLRIKNFRAIEDVNVEFDNRVNIIVGPNAIGKTTILESIRLAKALLCPRTQNESMQALFALGATSPHIPQQLAFPALARNPSIPVIIGIRFEMSKDEIEWLENSIPFVSRGIVQARMGQAFSNPTTLINFLGTPQGQQAIEAAQKEVASAIKVATNDNRGCRIELTISQQTGPQATDNSIWPSLISMLDQRHPPGLASFSYFPADRALPQGEQPVQLGMADAQAQLESHSSQPQTKYTRLKNTIFNAMIMSELGRQELITEFERIFTGILKGRRLKGMGLNHFGLLSIMVEDTETGRTFDIDGMSSGEKGLILTFLLIERSIAQDGLILLDEPELHLNPAVCKELLSFLVNGYAVRKNLQVFVCSHSPEILAGAFENDECSLYHLESELMLTKVRRQDHAVIAEALRRLGTSESEGLLFKGTVFVEGTDDISLLEAGFGTIFRRYKVKDLGGRREIEKEIKQLQDGEKEGIELSPRFFIFDRDESPSNLKNTKSTKILQWGRRCFENYLIDIDILGDLLMDSEIVKNPLKNLGEVSKLLRDLALGQLDDFVAKQIYSSYKYTDPGIRAAEIQGKKLDDISEMLHVRLLEIMKQTTSVDQSNWKNDFLNKCTEEREKLSNVWETKWQDECDGKRLFSELCQQVQPKMGPRKFKIRVMTEMRLRPSDNWRAVNGLLAELLANN
ncbi:ATP-dependent nuclease [Sideroxydans lithotrophicus]|uniref:SMC domain protein n=1 Tax=Sideroxydans lithotrophicus (strain ES-1) TaxID=580332 RepID=D5CUN0_SIDLE|nr:AAA family ATPase [Sideroxydans lithotrophicus]ADE12417.1 SMC domain protein [Sideroxydans lithotrophicus ES-1]